jgi:hypothetical protein
MSRSEADVLAAEVARAVPGAHIVVLPDDLAWRVEVHTTSAGACTLYDDDDWRWLEPQIVRGRCP